MPHKVSEEHLRTFNPAANLGTASQWQHGPVSLLEGGNNSVLHSLSTAGTHSVGTVHHAFFLASHATPIVKVEAHFVKMGHRQKPPDGLCDFYRNEPRLQASFGTETLGRTLAGFQSC